MKDDVLDKLKNISSELEETVAKLSERSFRVEGLNHRAKELLEKYTRNFSNKLSIDKSFVSELIEFIQLYELFFKESKYKTILDLFMKQNDKLTKSNEKSIQGGIATKQKTLPANTKLYELWITFDYITRSNVEKSANILQLYAEDNNKNPSNIKLPTGLSTLQNYVRNWKKGKTPTDNSLLIDAFRSFGNIPEDVRTDIEEHLYLKSSTLKG